MAALSEDSRFTYDGDSFFIQLSSRPTSRSEFNKCSSFTTFFPSPIRLGMDYEVSLHTVSIPTTWIMFKNRRDFYLEYRYIDVIYNDDTSIRAKDVEEKHGPWKRVYYPLGCYTTPDEFIGALTFSCGANTYRHSIMNFKDMVCLDYLSSTQKFYITAQTAVEMRFSNNAADVLGAIRTSRLGSNQMFGQGSHIFRLRPRIYDYLLDHINIKLDILKPEFHEDHYDQQLYTIDVRKFGLQKTTNRLVETLDRGIYKKLNTSEINSIAVSLTSDADRDIHFSPEASFNSHDNVTLLLHFQPVN